MFYWNRLHWDKWLAEYLCCTKRFSLVNLQKGPQTRFHFPFRNVKCRNIGWFKRKYWQKCAWLTGVPEWIQLHSESVPVQFSTPLPFSPFRLRPEHHSQTSGWTRAQHRSSSIGGLRHAAGSVWTSGQTGAAYLSMSGWGWDGQRGRRMKQEVQLKSDMSNRLFGKRDFCTNNKKHAAVVYTSKDVWVSVFVLMKGFQLSSHHSVCSRGHCFFCLCLPPLICVWAVSALFGTCVVQVALANKWPVDYLPLDRVSIRSSQQQHHYCVCKANSTFHPAPLTHIL